MPDKTDLEIWSIPTSQLGGSRTGITLRDYFAAKAMNGILSNPTMIDTATGQTIEWVAKNAYQMADTMLKARG